MYQKVIIVGNLGRDPELRYTPVGHPVTHLSLATNESWKDAAGQRQERTIWWRISVFGKQAELCCEYLQKGRQIFVEGCLRADPATGGPRIWTGQDGTTRAVFEVTAFNVRFVGSRPDVQDKPPAEAAAVVGDSGEESGREIPF